MAGRWDIANRLGPPPGEPFAVVAEERYIHRVVWQYRLAGPRVTPEQLARLLRQGRVVRDNRGDLRPARPDGLPDADHPPLAVLVDRHEEVVGEDDFPSEFEND